jgi:hypothetical protein
MIPEFGSLEYCMLCDYWVTDSDDEGHCCCPEGVECPDIFNGVGHA